MPETTTPTAAEQAAADSAAFAALADHLAGHPGVPQELREAMPTLVRDRARRDAFELEVLRQLAELRDLVTAKTAG